MWSSDLLQGNQALGLEADIDNHMLVGQLDDGAGDDLVAVGLDGGSLGGLLALEGFEGGGKIFSGFAAVVAMRALCLAAGVEAWAAGSTLRGLFGSNGGGRALPLSLLPQRIRPAATGSVEASASSAAGCDRFSACGGLWVGRGFGRRLLKLRRRLKGWGFQFGVQGYALGFGIEDV